jgi:predicted phage terminase large subunit-like protein
MELILASLDTSYGEKQENDFNALTVWGVWIDRAKNRRLMLMFAWNKRLPLHGIPVEYIQGEAKVNFEQRKQQSWGLIEWVANTCKKYKVQRLLIENKTRGRDVAQEINRLYARENWGVELIDPTGDKVSRAWSVEPLFADGTIWAPDTRWAEMVLTQCQSFPKSDHDDLVDTASMAISWLRESGLIMRGDEMSAAMEDDMMNFRRQESVAESYGVLH